MASWRMKPIFSSFCEIRPDFRFLRFARYRVSFESIRESRDNFKREKKEREYFRPAV